VATAGLFHKVFIYNSTVEFRKKINLWKFLFKIIWIDLISESSSIPWINLVPMKNALLVRKTTRAEWGAACEGAGALGPFVLVDLGPGLGDFEGFFVV
jgi:hypothetical protein